MPAAHPWQVTLRQFLDHARRERGVEIYEGRWQGSQGETRFLWAYLEQLGRITVVPGCDLDELLAPDVLRSLCVQFGIPSDDFLLDADDGDDDDDE